MTRLFVRSYGQLTCRLTAILLIAFAWTVPAFCGPIHNAARSGNVEEARKLLQADPSLVASRDGALNETPLHIAAEYGQKSVAELLLTFHADVDARDSRGHTPLHAAALVSWPHYGEGQTDVAMVLIAHGADPNARVSGGKAAALQMVVRGAISDEKGITALGIANYYVSKGYKDHLVLQDLLLLFAGRPGSSNAPVNLGFTPLMTAALTCDETRVTALLQQGADFRETDSFGNNALTLASSRRTNDMSLQCPGVVSALTKAGADPWSARFYQNPDLQTRQLTKIAVLRIEDTRSTRKGNGENALAEAVEAALSNKIPVATPVTPPHYPILKLSEAREKLKSAGFSEQEVLRPERRRACSVLGVSAVFEAHSRDYTHMQVGVTESSAAKIEYELTDCKTGDLLWRKDYGTYGETRGFLAGLVSSSYAAVCEQTITIPRYQGPE